MTTPQMDTGMMSLFRQMMSGGRPMTQRAGLFGKLAGKVAMSAVSGPIGIGLMGLSMLGPMMAMRQGAQEGDGQTGSSLDRLSEKLDEVTSGLHRMNVEVKQLSDSVGQTSSDTLKMGAAFASIGADNATGQGAELAKQLGRQTGAMRLGQMGQGTLMGAGLLGLNTGQMMQQTPAEQLNYIIDELRKLNKTELNSVDTLHAIEMFLPGQGQNLIAMANMGQGAIDDRRNYELALDAFMSGPRGRAIENQSQALLAIASRVSMQADLFDREREYLRTPFSTERAERQEQRGKTMQQFGMGWLEGLQGSKTLTETWAREIHEVFQRFLGSGTASQLRSLGWELGNIVSGLLEIVHAGIIFGSWVKDIVKLLVSVVMMPMEWASGRDAMKPIREAWGGLNFQAGTMTGDLAIGLEQAQEARRIGDARIATGVNRGYASGTNNRNMGNGMNGSDKLVVEFRAKDDFSNMLQYETRKNTNRGRAVPGPQASRVPSIAER